MLSPDPYYSPTFFGAIAQLGERNTGSVEVSGSIPLSSTKLEKPRTECQCEVFLFMNGGSAFASEKSSLPSSSGGCVNPPEEDGFVKIFTNKYAFAGLGMMEVFLHGVDP